MIVFGFDPGTKFGWSVFVDGVRVASGVWLTNPKDSHPGYRFEYARKQLLWVFGKYPGPARIGYEDINVTVFRDKNNLRVYAGLVAAMLQAASIAGITDIQGVGPKTLKKHATGTGNATKALMIDACIKKFDVAPDSDDEADAIWVGDYYSKAA